jgi:hypothetical protein
VEVMVVKPVADIEELLPLVELPPPEPTVIV